MPRLTDEDFGRLTCELAAGLAQISDRVGIVVVANVKARTVPTVEYKAQSASTEFFSELEIQHVLTELRSADVFVTPFYDEREFMAWVLASGHKHLPVENILVYNAAQNGAGPGRKSLTPAFCNLQRIPITGSDAYVVGLCRHKYHLNRLLRSCGFRVPESWWYLGADAWALDRRPPEGRLVIVKLTYESASLGLDDGSVGQWGSALQLKADALVTDFAQPILVQDFVAGREVECPVVVDSLGSWSDAISLRMPGAAKFLTYDMVYDDKYGFQGPDGSPEFLNSLMDQAAECARLIGFRGIGRVDFRVDEEGIPHTIDIATNPHLVHHSSVAFSFNRVRAGCSPFVLLAALKMKEIGWFQELDQK